MASRRLAIPLLSRQYSKCVLSFRQSRRLKTCSNLCNDKTCNGHLIQNRKGTHATNSDSSTAPPESKPVSRFSGLKRARYRTTLSVFDRVSQLLPQNFQADEEVANTFKQEKDKDSTENHSFENYAGDKENRSDATIQGIDEKVHQTSSPSSDPSVARQQDETFSDSFPSQNGDNESEADNASLGVPFMAGELVVGERENTKRHEYMKLMFNLDASKSFTTKHGAIKHVDIIGKYPGDVFISSRGMKVSLHRATLEDYILYMKRTPVISYPKDCITMSMLIDANPGDTILEAGAGSGGMTLFLSRAVGHTGHVHSFEVNEKHHGRAVKNFHRWLQSWNLSHDGNRWPSNVIFHHQRLQDGEETLGNLTFDGAIIDMENPHLAMPFVARRLKAGRAVAIYMANLTQVIETLAYIDSKNVPLETSTVMEVTHRTWLVAQAKRHSGQLVKKNLMKNLVQRVQRIMAQFILPSQHTGNIHTQVLYLQAFVIIVLLGKLFRKMFFGQLRPAEVEHLIERSWYAVTETCLAFTVFREDFSPRFVAMFTFLLFLKCFHWLGEDRVDYMERSPVITWVFHLRVMALLAVLALFDAFFINHAYYSTITRGATAQLVFGFEYAILLIIVMNVFFKYVLHTIDLQSENPWENKAVYLLYTELFMGFFKVLLYMAFMAVMIKVHTFPLFAIRPMYLSMRSFKKALHDVIMSRRAIRNMNTLYPDATPEELSSGDNVCIICREEMVTGCKKLPCNHIFHTNCLRSWFQRQQTCPTCRMDILRAPLPTTRQQQPRTPQQQQQQQQQANNMMPGQGQMMPPFPGGFPMWMPPMAPGHFQMPPQQPPTSQPDTSQPSASTTTTSSTTTQPTAAPTGSQTTTSPGSTIPTASAAAFPSAIPTTTAGLPGMMPPFSMPSMMPPFMPPPMPPPNFAGLNDSELQAMEGLERSHVEARIQCLRSIHILLDAAMVQIQQYYSLMSTLGPAMQQTSSASLPTSATGTTGTASKSTEQSQAESKNSTLGVEDISELEGAVGFASSTEQAIPEQKEDPIDETDHQEIRRRRIQRLESEKNLEKLGEEGDDSIAPDEHSHVE
ncbi:E3 ubiquitin-protein ligase synoviolin-like [Glandiceps talaboti]